jgi:hypothetical protein
MKTTTNPTKPKAPPPEPSHALRMMRLHLLRIAQNLAVGTTALNPTGVGHWALWEMTLRSKGWNELAYLCYDLSAPINNGEVSPPPHTRSKS